MPSRIRCWGTFAAVILQPPWLMLVPLFFPLLVLNLGRKKGSHCNERACGKMKQRANPSGTEEALQTTQRDTSTCNRQRRMILHLLLCSLFYLFCSQLKDYVQSFSKSQCTFGQLNLLLGPISMTYIDLEKKVSSYHGHVEIKQSSSARECIVGLALFSQLHLFQAIIGYRSCFSTTAVEMLLLLLLCALCKPSFKV